MRSAPYWFWIAAIAVGMTMGCQRSPSGADDSTNQNGQSPSQNAKTPAKASGLQLPGGKGPVFATVANSDPEVIAGDVTAELNLEPGPVPKARIIDAGVKEVFVIVWFNGDPAGRQVSISLHNNNGPVQMNPGASLQERDAATGKLTLHMPLKAKAGQFEDGPYQARVEIDGKVVAQINWQVGKLY